MKNKKLILISVMMLIILSMALASCKPAQPPETQQPAAQQPAAQEPATQQPAAQKPATEQPAAPAEAKPLTTWYQYDQKNEDPASDERAGNQWIRETIPAFDKAFEGKWYWDNIPKAWDKLAAELTAAVIAGGDVPDIVEIGGLQVQTYLQNGVLMDLTDWMKAQPWFADLDPGAIDTCTGPDGRIYCVPTAERPFVVYVWSELYPNGLPKTPEQFMVEAERLKAEGHYAWTYFGSTQFAGNGSVRGLFSVIASFGGGYETPDGQMLLNTPENVAAITFLRETVQKGYNPDTVFAGGFIEEDSFKDSSAAAFPTGLFGYRYVNPLTAPDGTKFEKGNEQDMIDAIAAGKVVLAPMFAPEGKTPSCGLDGMSVGIPVGAPNLDAAYDFINWLMTDQDQFVKYVVSAGGGFPALISAQKHPDLQTPFYKQAADAINASKCKMAIKNMSRPDEAAETIMNAIYKLIKDDPKADIPTVLQQAQDEYNAGN